MDYPTFFLRALLVAATTALGSLPLAAVKTLTAVHMGASISIACGMMTGCACVLAFESVLSSNIILVSISVAAGAALIASIQWLFSGRDDLTFGDLTGSNAAAGLVIFFSMLVHSIGEGLSMGVSAIHSEEGSGLNLVVLCSLAIHNIPEGMAICMSFRSKGMSIKRSAWYAFLSNLPQPLSAVPTFWMMKRFASIGNVVPIGLGVSSGAMAYVVVQELVPEAMEKLPQKKAWPIIILSCALVVAVDVWSHFGSGSVGGGDAAAFEAIPFASVAAEL
jgi:zinc transporter ZupT|eukprot:TRINITY_DN29053_c0_g1_i1.p1 TRINITY_DN29053_c0_g1~~TRINITY_DN29053_c0_g1_i1.p1  ORF type:complete len:277 (-),score=49.20 TRINITY_DN29053_c0_g1_i1:216-1046(-)